MALPDEEKRKQEMGSLLRINDSFKKISIVKDDIKPWRDENGILTMGLLDFLMNADSLEQKADAHNKEAQKKNDKRNNRRDFAGY